MTGPTVDRIVHGLYTLCALLILADVFYQKHPHFKFESLFGFYGLFGFFGSVGLVLLAKQLRRVLMRKEDHYGDTKPVDAIGKKER